MVTTLMVLFQRVARTKKHYKNERYPVTYKKTHKHTMQNLQRNHMTGRVGTTPTKNATTSAKHQKNPQFLPFQTKMFQRLLFVIFFCNILGSSPLLIGERTGVPAMTITLLYGI